MKGFIKMLEVILAAIIMLTSMSYFFSFQSRNSEWPSALLQSTGKDVLASLDQSGSMRMLVQTNNLTESSMGLEYYIRKMLPRTVLYSVELEGIPKPDITIGCNCTFAERQSLIREMMVFQGYQGNTTCMGRRINFTVLGENNLSELLSDTSVDIIVIFDYIDLSPYQKQIDEFLERRKSILASMDIQQSSVNAYFSGLFGISFKPGSPSTSSRSFRNFTDYRNLSRTLSGYFAGVPMRINCTERVFAGSDIERRGYIYIEGSSYPVSTYFDGIRSRLNYTGSIYSSGDNFTISASGNVWTLNIRNIDAVYAGDEWTYADVAITNRSYVFAIPTSIGYNNVSSDSKTILNSSDGFSSMQASMHASSNGNGRTIWMPSYQRNLTDNNQLFKAALLWLASERFNLDDEIGDPRPIPTTYEKVSYIVSGNSEFEPYTMSILLWYLF